MDRIINFLKQNIPAIVISTFFYGLFLYFSYTGNRMCDCQSTEKYRANQNGSRISTYHYYHK
ncbi:hypothetical protein HYN48_01990 [Flavobacterium magnum]|uniref:Uncharacterized protein n=1 Tax=Flavobacterium magnum TaxID=2162713 RepID=A0A2S0RE15_9FLAO|nr:hypothetical protein HYN48_01990 [Flavobacterium magnum]